MLLFIENNTLVALFDVFMYYFICYEILSTAKDGRAQHILHLGYQRVQEWGNRIEEASLKQSFFENVPSNKKIIAAWNGHNIPK